MKKFLKSVLLVLTALLCGTFFTGCGAEQTATKDGHEPLTILSAAINYDAFKALLHEKHPEIQLEFISYTGGNYTGYTQYTLKNNAIPDIYNVTVFSLEDKQRENLLDLSGYDFLGNYKTTDINQVSLDGSVYLLPASSNIMGLYYNKTLFEEKGWAVPRNFEELKALAQTIRAEGTDPTAAQFELAGNGFFDLFTIGKTDYLSTPEGLKWEADFKAGRATAREGLSDAAAQLQELIDCGFLDAEDTTRSHDECQNYFYSRGAAMYLNAGNLPRLTQNEDGSGDQYGLMPFYGKGENHSVLINVPLTYYGLSKKLAAPGSEQKLEDALKVMELLSTEEGQKALSAARITYIAPFKNSVIPESSPFYPLKDTIQSGNTSTLAYAGYEPIIIDVGNKVRDWVAGKCTGEDVLSLMDTAQSEYLNGSRPPITVAAQDFTQEETAQLQAEAFRQAAGTDIGLVSLGGYNGAENNSGVCGNIFKGDITEDAVNIVLPGKFSDPICTLTLSGKELRELLETGFVTAEGTEGFPYIPAGLKVTRKADGAAAQITLENGAALDEAARYTIAVDKGGFTEETGKAGNAQETGLRINEVLKAYLSSNSPIAPLEHSVITK